MLYIWVFRKVFCNFIEILPIVVECHLTTRSIRISALRKLHNSTSNHQILLLLLFSSFTFDFYKNQNATSPVGIFSVVSQIEFHLYQLIKSLVQSQSLQLLYFTKVRTATHHITLDHTRTFMFSVCKMIFPKWTKLDQELIQCGKRWALFRCQA